MITKKERRDWLFVVGLTAVIYATLPIARGLANRIEGAGYGKILYIGPAVIVVFAFLAALFYILKQPYPHRLLRKLRIFCMITIGSLYALFLKYLGKIPIERIHLLEYGLLSILAKRAFDNRASGLLSYLFSVALTALIGLVDELIQGVLPDRFFDWRDVSTNALSGILGLLLWACITEKSIRQLVRMPR